MRSSRQNVPLAELGVLDRGKSRHRPRYDPILYGGEYPFIQTGDIKASGGRISTYSQTYNEVGLAQSRLWKPGTLCITIAANIAETAILTIPACFPDSVVGFIADESKVDVAYVEYAFRYLRSKVQSDASGSVQDNINLEYLRKLELPICSLSEQKAIAHILGTLDDKIELNRRSNETLEAIAKALFKSWFVDFDPVRAKAEGRPTGLPEDLSALFPDSFDESATGEIPSNWAVRSLDDIATFLNGLALQKFPPGEGASLPVIKIAQLRKGDAVGADRCSREVPPAYVLRDGDILFSWSGSLEVEVWCGGEGALNQHLFKVCSSEFLDWFVFYWTRYHLDGFRQIAASKATTMGHIQRHHLSDAKVLVPPQSLLQAIDATFSPLYEKAVANRLEQRTLGALRDLLLPKLISGELRVTDAENVLEAVGV